ncbi:hypothetical protein FRB96_000394 [Tulasnella sp. 330]|nr:hypothetical protein FRB96_000394 [Tulasnella sp. 330]KAG8890949.1 hypothetical protein FRB98_002969 [Tulasnella sp. 332]
MATVACNDTATKDFPMIMSTSFTQDLSRSDTLKFLTDLSNNNLQNSVVSLLKWAASDIINNMEIVLNVTNNAGPTALSYFQIVNPDFYCHNERLGDVDPSCSAIPPDLPIDEPALVFANAQVSYQGSTPPGLLTNYSAAISNTMQIMLAAVRLDIGNIFPNNFLVYPDAINATIAPELPVPGASASLDTSSGLYGIGISKQLHDDRITGTSDNVLFMPMNASQPSVIDIQYLCHFPQEKSPGQAFVSVLVATLSMFSSGWAAFLLVATYFAKRNSLQANVCDGHVDLERSNLESRDGEIPLLATHHRYEQ